MLGKLSVSAVSVVTKLSVSAVSVVTCDLYQNTIVGDTYRFPS